MLLDSRTLLILKVTFFLQLGFDPANSLIGSIGILNKLASWARRNNKPRDSDPEQFDVASLLLR